MQHFRRSRFAAQLLVSTLCAPALLAQTKLYTFTGTSGDQLGRSVGPAGDVDNDGYDDVIVGSPLDDPNGASSGRVIVFSGRTGSALLTLDGSFAGDEFGTSVDGVGDIDHDGFDDIVVGAPGHDFGGGNAGTVCVYTGKTGAMKFQWFGSQAGAYFGHAVAGAGDTNNDGYVDVVVGAPFEDSSGANAGRVRVFSGLTGGTLRIIDGSAANDEFGRSVDGVGDANHDGFDDFIAGAPNHDAGGNNAGVVRVYSGKEGWATHLFYGGEANALFGHAVAGLGDVDGDLCPDFAVGAPFSDYNGVDSGEVRVYSGAAGTEHYRVGGAAGTRMGTSVAGVGDVDDDGHNDVLVGAPKWGFLGTDDVGLVRVYSGSDGSSIVTFMGSSADDELGTAVGSAGDVNNDGTPDIVAAAPFADSHGSNAGYASVWLMDAPYPTTYCTAKVNSLGCVPRISTSGIPSLHTADNFYIGATDVLNNKPGMLLWGMRSASTPFYGGLLCIAPTIHRTSVQNSGGSSTGLDCSGSYSFHFSQAYMSSQGLLPGTTVKAQYWSRDPGFAAPFNIGLTNALSFVVLN